MEGPAKHIDRSSAITSQSKCDLFPKESFQYQESWRADERVCVCVRMCVCLCGGSGSLLTKTTTYLSTLLLPVSLRLALSPPIHLYISVFSCHLFLATSFLLTHNSVSPSLTLSTPPLCPPFSPYTHPLSIHILPQSYLSVSFFFMILHHVPHSSHTPPILPFLPFPPSRPPSSPSPPDCSPVRLSF